jgi:hypothetical protein
VKTRKTRKAIWKTCTDYRSRLEACTRAQCDQPITRSERYHETLWTEGTSKSFPKTRLKLHEFPDKKKVESRHSHNLRELVRVAGLDDARAERAGKDPDFRANWDVVQAWSEHSRYQKHREESARLLLAAIGGRSHGVFSWIKLHW